MERIKKKFLFEAQASVSQEQIKIEMLSRAQTEFQSQFKQSRDCKTRSIWPILAYQHTDLQTDRQCVDAL